MRTRNIPKKKLYTLIPFSAFLETILLSSLKSMGLMLGLHLYCLTAMVNPKRAVYTCISHTYLPENRKKTGLILDSGSTFLIAT